jgi:protein-tyrosine phosphatase
MIRVLFLCLGNICRSPMAEAVFMDKVRKAGLADRIEADSAGTGSWHLGEPPHRGTRKVLEKQGIRYSGRSRLLVERDHDQFDYIIAMDRHNYRDALSLGSGKAKVATLMSFAPELGYDDVPDPYYDGRFDDVYMLVNVACEELLKSIREECGL